MNFCLGRLASARAKSVIAIAPWRLDRNTVPHHRRRSKSTMVTDLEETLESADPGMTSTNLSPVSNFDAALTADITAISRIDAVASILEIVCRTTGMGFAAVARVTRDRWVACAVRDEIAFGLLPGGELDVKTTICDEIRDSGRAVVIDHVAQDEAFSRSSYAETIRASELHLDADHSSERRLLRHVVRNRSTAGKVEQARSHWHVQELRPADRLPSGRAGARGETGRRSPGRARSGQAARAICRYSGPRSPEPARLD